MSLELPCTRGRGTPSCPLDLEIPWKVVTLGHLEANVRIT